MAEDLELKFSPSDKQITRAEIFSFFPNLPSISPWFSLSASGAAPGSHPAAGREAGRLPKVAIRLSSRAFASDQ